MSDQGQEGDLAWRRLLRIQELEAKKNQLQRWKDEALPVIHGLQDLGRALNVPLGTRITGEGAAKIARDLVAERDQLRVERDALLSERHAQVSMIAQLTSEIEQQRVMWLREATSRDDLATKLEQIKEWAQGTPTGVYLYDCGGDWASGYDEAMEHVLNMIKGDKRCEDYRNEEHETPKRCVLKAGHTGQHAWQRYHRSDGQEQDVS